MQIYYERNMFNIQFLGIVKTKTVQIKSLFFQVRKF